jgi:hypothetical protein
LISHQYAVCIPLRPHWCYMPCPSHPLWLDHSNYTWRRIQVMKYFLIKYADIMATIQLQIGVQ